MRGEVLERRHRHVLELERDHVDGRRECVQGGLVRITRAGECGRDVGGGAVGLGREDMAAIAEPGRRESRHAAELATAQDADRGAGRNRGHGALSRGVSATASVCRARHAARRSASAGSASARIAAASSPALIAPGRPIASVPTGTPPGIWTIE